LQKSSTAGRKSSRTRTSVSTGQGPADLPDPMSALGQVASAGLLERGYATSADEPGLSRFLADLKHRDAYLRPSRALDLSAWDIGPR
jgi:hypothetical protein